MGERLTESTEAFFSYVLTFSLLLPIFSWITIIKSVLRKLSLNFHVFEIARSAKSSMSNYIHRLGSIKASPFHCGIFDEDGWHKVRSLGYVFISG